MASRPDESEVLQYEIEQLDLDIQREEHLLLRVMQTNLMLRRKLALVSMVCVCGVWYVCAIDPARSRSSVSFMIGNSSGFLKMIKS